MASPFTVIVLLSLGTGNIECRQRATTTLIVTTIYKEIGGTAMEIEIL